ncbi:Ribonuclease H-like domain [Lasallia pustulata]|uniref:Ribonuclease H-like domain n=1 Tax=Lasallia pustulata TaxID=136370 RepID=A0A1W5D0Y5_9LECA|nr:Ribonuclease H-like domain [Lasallia pustulata]
MANRQYTSVLDLAFTTGQLAAEIIDWQINENEYSGSDHEVIQFSITTEDIELVESPFNAPFNIQKANWAEFNQQLVQESQSMLTELRQLETQDLNQEQMETIACSLRDLITKAAEQNIPRRKPCSRSKVWWNPNLTLLRKEMAKQSRVYKRHDQSQQQWTKFASCRAEYFYAIKTAKRNSWTKFLSEANGKEVFQAYKYTKPRLMEKIPPIQTADGKLCHTFNDKCQTFVKAMYPKPPEINQNPDRPNAPEAQWSSLTNNEVKQAIFTSSPKKAAGPDEIGFAIIQEAYKAIAEVMNLTYKILIRNSFHPQCWREGTGVILKKAGKPDYSLPKAYRIITLLNCLGKVAEKIMATRLSYLSQISDLLDTDQTGGRKQRSAVDAVMALTHDIELARNQKQTLSCLFLDVKGAFDHVSTKQLLRIMSELQLPRQVQNWTKSFLEKRKAGLAFDGEKQRIQGIEIGIPQGSPISPVLFLIYIRFLFPKIKAKFPEVQKPSYIDNVALYTTGRNAEENAKVLQEVTKTVFTWAEENAVQIDDSKTELIHFARGQKEATAEVILPNKTVIKPVNEVKWLGIWLDRKLTFKTHVQKKASAATSVLHLIHRLMNSEWGLSAQAGKQLYTACITSISDYGAEIWWKNQRSYQDLLQKLQNTALRKILGAFRTSPGAAMEIEASIEPVKVRLNKKCRKYALRVTTLPENHCIRQRTPMSYPPESSIGQEVPIQGNYLDWNQNAQRKSQRHPTQLIRILNSISTLIPTGTKLDSQSAANPPWQDTFAELADLSISGEDRDLVVKKHLTHIRQLIDQNHPIFYTDGSKLESNVNSQAKASVGAGIYWIFGKVISSESHFLGHTQEIMDAEIYAISQALERITDAKTRKKHFWVFTDSQSAIQNLQKDQMETEVYRDMRQNLEEIKAQGRKPKKEPEMQTQR